MELFAPTIRSAIMRYRANERTLNRLIAMLVPVVFPSMHCSPPKARVLDEEQWIKEIGNPWVDGEYDPNLNALFLRYPVRPENVVHELAHWAQYCRRGGGRRLEGKRLTPEEHTQSEAEAGHVAQEFGPKARQLYQEILDAPRSNPMPDLRGFLPLLPWEGPPIPRALAGGDGGPAFEHWQRTGNYLYKGKEYLAPPHQLEVDTQRGVLYLHNLLSGMTVLRVCRIPGDILDVFMSRVGSTTISLLYTHTGGGIPRGRIVKREPVFLSFPPDVSTSFDINDVDVRTIFSFRDVPYKLVNDLLMGGVVDITLGITGRESDARPS